MQAEEDASLKENDSGNATSQDDNSFQSCGLKNTGTCLGSASGASNTRYQKRVVPSTGGFNLVLLVQDINIVIEKTRVDRSQVRLAECEVGDETGTVSLRARDEQIDLLQNISSRGGAVVLRNCSVELYQGKFIRLAISKWGKISSFPDGIKSTPSPPAMVNNELNLSIVDLNDVAGDEWFEVSSIPSSNQNQSRSPRDNSAAEFEYSKDQNPRYLHHQRGGGGGHSHNHGNRKGSVRYNEKRGHSHGHGHIQHGMYTGPNRSAMRMPNMNHVNMVPSMNDFSPIYQHPSTIAHYGFGQSGPHRQHQQHFNPQQQQKQQDYLLFQQYNIQMQLEAMQLYGQRTGLSNSQVHGYSQPHNHSLPPDGMNPRMEARSGNWNSNMTPEPTMAISSSTRGSQISPDEFSLRDYHSNITPSQSNDDAWSIRREAQSPMMNPHAASFVSNYPVPNLTLPPQEQYYEQSLAYNPGQHSSSPISHGKGNKGIDQGLESGVKKTAKPRYGMDRFVYNKKRSAVPEYLSSAHPKLTSINGAKY